MKAPIAMTRANAIQAMERYNAIAGFRSWLPIGIGEHSSPQALRDAARQVAPFTERDGPYIAAILLERANAIEAIAAMRH